MAANNNTNNVEEIDLLKLAKALWAKAWAIVLAAMVFGSAAFYWTYRSVYTTYRSSALIYVNNSSLSLGSTKLSISSGDIRAVNNLMETYSVILMSRNTMQEIIAETGLPFTYEEMTKMVTTETVGETAIFKITVTADNPEVAAHVANSILNVLPEKISTVVEGSSAQIVEYAVPGEPVVNGNPVKSAAIGAMIGIVLSCGVIILMYMLDTKVRNEEYLLDTYKDIPVLSSIPDLSTSGKGYGYYGYRKAYAQSAKQARTSSSGSGVREPVHSGTSTSASEEVKKRPGNEGK